jgi:lipopolysaccharide transport system ATP-binding protein
MSDIAIRVEKLGKQYRIGAKRERYSTLRDRLATTFSAPWRSLSGAFRNPKSEIRNPQSETIWALKDVSFEVKRGEVVGIIGRNGAGKSTLLKILSRITEPTEGYAEVHGRVGSLLEVGTGFHPELTGGENIYLNGAILGMKRAEIEAKFDEIVAFAEVESFIDTPVKHYSSGMYLRLAFAVAAHLNPDILLVDEVLAVGDLAFQRRCQGKMEDVSRTGRTVLFVSHNLRAIEAICGRLLVLEKGVLVHAGDFSSGLQLYLRLSRSSDSKVADDLGRSGAGIVRYRKLWVNGATDFGGAFALRTGSSLRISAELASLDGRTGIRRGLDVAFIIRDVSGHVVATLANFFSGECSDLHFSRGLVTISCVVPALPLVPGDYRFDLWCASCGQLYDLVADALTLHVTPGDATHSEDLRKPSPQKHGALLLNQGWTSGLANG